LLKEPLSSEGRWHIEKYHLSRLENEELIAIRSGDVFTLTTDDPQARPLPHWDLMEMQWMLQRLVGISGAADWPELDLSEEDDDDFYTSTMPDLLPDEGGPTDSSPETVRDWIPPPTSAEDAKVTETATGAMEVVEARVM
jgi:hypothetical protein